MRGAQLNRLGKRTAWGVAIMCLCLGGLEFIIHRHSVLSLEELPLFYSLFGFIAFLMIVVGGVLLRKFIMRAPDYYDEIPDHSDQMERARK